jgi:hypothetical protein
MNAGTRDQYIAGYVGELNYLNQILKKTIDEILANSETPPIIILQGDHGSRAYLDWSSAENTCMHERVAIFNAYYFPDQPAELYDEITPINSFRVVFNNYLGGNFELITDERSYFSLWDKPYDFYDVTNRLEQPCGE